MVDVGEDVEHRLQVADAELVVELVGEGLEVDVGGIHDGEEFARRLAVDVAGGDGDVADALLAAGERGVDGVFGEDDRVVVGVGDGVGAVALGGGGDHLRAGFVHQAIHVLRLGDVPVLAELAGEVAAGGAEGEDAAAGVEVVERLLLDRVDAEAGGAAVGGQLHGAIDHLAHEAGAALAFVQLAVARAEVALHAAVGQGMPPAAGVEGFGGSSWQGSFHFLTE